MQKSLKKSPLKDKPLRNPGQSLQREIDKVYENDVTESALLITITVFLSVVCWLIWFFKVPPLTTAVVSTVYAVAGTVYGIWKLNKTKQHIKLLKMARDGEKTVAEHLEELRNEGCHVLHDLVGQNFNIDHIIVSSKGIFAVETKTRSKIGDKNEIVEFNGEYIKIDGYDISEDINIQTEAQRVSLKKILQESTGKSFHIRSVVTFPGWFVKHTGRNKDGNLSVLNPNQIQSFMKYQSSVLSDEDVNLVTFHLKRYIRTKVD
jgi:hypothetical protein